MCIRDRIYTGYLSGVSQVEWVEQFMQEFANPQTKIFVDPVLGDEGVYYRGFGDEMCQAMKKLCGKADVITPVSYTHLDVYKRQLH